MKFQTVCLLGIFTSAPFGLAFLLSPEITTTAYGISGWTPGTEIVGRLLGVHLLYLASANMALWTCTEADVQRRFRQLFCAVSLLAAGVALYAALRPEARLLNWLTVLTYAFFSYAWATAELSAPEAQPH